MERIKEMDISTKKKLVIGLAVICIGLIITYYFTSNRRVDYSKIKKENNKNMVYTISSKTDEKIFIKEIPHLNLNFEFVDNINNDVNTYVSSLQDTSHATISYDYNINGDVLSYVIKMINYDYEVGPKIYFKGYNINLKKKKIITDQELLDLFGYNVEDVEKSIEKGFKSYYKDMLKKGYYDSEECDYDCFIHSYRDVENYLDDVVLYVKGGKLYAYKPFSFYSILGDEEYFKEKHFMFLIGK